MELRDYFKLLRQYLGLNPRLSQHINLIRYAKAYFLNDFKPVVSYSPISIGFYISYKCNLRCKYCWNPAINQKDFVKEDITVEEFENFLQNEYINRAFRFSFVGGEPLVHKDLFRFIELSYRAKKLTMFPTNGLLIKDRIDEFEKSHLTSLQLSLYDEHLSKQLENARLLRKKNPCINIVFSHYVTKETYKSVEDVIRYALEMGVKELCIQNFVPLEERGKEFVIYDDNVEVINYYKAIQKKYHDRFTILEPGFLTRDETKRFCYDLYTTVFVGKDGNLSPCSSIAPPSSEYGNIYRDNFWNNEYMVKFRENYVKRFPFHEDCKYCYCGTGYVRRFV